MFVHAGASQNQNTIKLSGLAVIDEKTPVLEKVVRLLL